jgi:hypothetical protein
LIGNLVYGVVLVKQTTSATWLALAVTVLVAGIETRAYAASVASYAASADPGVAPDANANSVDAWTVSTMIPPGGGNGAGSFFGFGDNWVLYSFPDGPTAGASQADHTLAGGPLAVGQTMSIRWANRAIQAGTSVGVSLMAGSSPAITVRFQGGGSYLVDDVTPAQPLAEPFHYETLTPLSITLLSPTTYSGVFGATAFSGTYAGSISGVRVFNGGAGNGSDVFFNNLTIAVPEPGSLALIAIGALTLAARWRAGVRN